MFSYHACGEEIGVIGRNKSTSISHRTVYYSEEPSVGGSRTS
jgi:hypothetical protein